MYILKYVKLSLNIVFLTLDRSYVINCMYCGTSLVLLQIVGHQEQKLADACEHCNHGNIMNLNCMAARCAGTG